MGENRTNRTPHIIKIVYLFLWLEVKKTGRFWQSRSLSKVAMLSWLIIVSIGLSNIPFISPLWSDNPRNFLIVSYLAFLSIIFAGMLTSTLMSRDQVILPLNPF